MDDVSSTIMQFLRSGFRFYKLDLLSLQLKYIAVTRKEKKRKKSFTIDRAMKPVYQYRLSRKNVDSVWMVIKALKFPAAI